MYVEGSDGGGQVWYLRPVVRFMLDVQDVHIDWLSPCNAATWQTPMGAQIGRQDRAAALQSKITF